VPSFLQETCTVRGQIAYATTELKAKRKVPPDLDKDDDVAMSRMERIVPLFEIAALGANVASPVGSVLRSATDATVKGQGPGDGVLVSKAVPFTMPFPTMLKVVLERQAKLFNRDPTLTRARIMQCIIIGLIVGGLWFRHDINAISARCAVTALPPRCRAACNITH
jgi:hypothetical protein